MRLRKLREEVCLAWRVAVGGCKPDMSKLKINPGFCARLQTEATEAPQRRSSSVSWLGGDAGSRLRFYRRDERQRELLLVAIAVLPSLRISETTPACVL